MNKYIKIVLLLIASSLSADELEYEFGFAKVSFNKEVSGNAVKVSIGDTVNEYESNISHSFKLSYLNIPSDKKSIINGFYRPSYKILEDTTIYGQVGLAILPFMSKKYIGYMFGTGIQYKINDKYFINFDYVKGSLENEDSKLKTTITSLNIGYKF